MAESCSPCASVRMRHVAVGVTLPALPFPAPQVACFCTTSMAAELAVEGALPVGGTFEASEALLQQTEEASSALAQLDATRILDIRPGASLTPSWAISMLGGVQPICAA